MRGTAAGVVACALVAWSSAARADDQEPPPATATPPPVTTHVVTKLDDSYSHAGQVGISARVGTGMRFLSTYQQTTPCDDTGDRACFAREPFTLELEAAYGIDSRIDVLAEISFGLEQDFSSIPQIDNGPHLVRLSPGFRFFFGQSKNSKLFATIQAVFDFSEYKDAGGMSLGNDFGLRNINAFMYDVNHSFGFYLFGGETFGFARWFDVELEAGVGVQLRYP